MISRFPCPYLGAKVELTQERERHIAEGHPDLLHAFREELAETLAQPDQIRRSSRFGNARLFGRWYAEVRGGKHVVVVVVTQPDTKRHWIITAYLTGRLIEGDIEWRRS